MKKIGIVLLILLAVVFEGAVYVRNHSSKTPTESIGNTPSAGKITIQGKIVCLPHKDTSGPQTLECAFGLKDSEGRYFGLRDSDDGYRNISNVEMNVPVIVEGTFTPKSDSNYQDIGTIEVTRISKN